MSILACCQQNQGAQLTDTNPQNSLGQVNSFAVISDVHLQHPGDACEEILIQILQELKDSYEAIFFLGDIFDFIFAKQKFYRKHWSRFFAVCAELQKKGVRLFFVEGNHDFGFDGAFFFRQGIFERVVDGTFALRHPVLGRVFLRHGDDIVCKPSYRCFRSVVKNSVVQSLVSLIPGRILNRVFLYYAEVSRNRPYRALEPAFFSRTVRGYLQCLSPAPQVLILGHVHVWVDALFSNGTTSAVPETRVLVGPDWISAPNVLLVSATGAVKRQFHGSGVSQPSLFLCPP